MKLLTCLFVVFSASNTLISAVKLFETPGDISTTVPARCRVALTYNITCDFLVTTDQAQQEYHLVGDALTGYCSDSCSESIAEFQQSVTDACGHTLYAFQEDSERKSSAQALAEGFSWAQNLICIQEGDEYCLGDLYNGTVEACSDCILHYGAVMQESPYGRSRFSEANFIKMLQNCDADPDDYPYTYTPEPPAPTTTTDPPEPSPEPLCRGEIYTAREGDDCDSIALANSVSSFRLIDVNKLDVQCQMLQPGRELCIRDTCKLATIQQNQTCDDVVRDKGFSIVQLMSWNPELKTKCNTNITPNLNQFKGRHICIEPPGNVPFPTTSESISTGHAQLSSSIFTGSWVTGSVETSPTQGPITLTSEFDPTFTPPPETMTWDPDLADKEREWTQWCWITDEDWQEYFHPDVLPGACQSFFSRWCEYDTELPSPTSMGRFPAICTPDCSNYGPLPPPVVTPSPIQNGVPDNCNKWHFVEKGELCDSIAEEHEIPVDDLYEWNPAVGHDCTGLWANVYICVGVRDE